MTGRALGEIAAEEVGLVADHDRELAERGAWARECAAAVVSGGAVPRPPPHSRSLERLGRLAALARERRSAEGRDG